MILQQNIFEKLKASRKAKLKPDHFQHMHENTHKMKMILENRIRKARQNQLPFKLISHTAQFVKVDYEP